MLLADPFHKETFGHFFFHGNKDIRPKIRSNKKEIIDPTQTYDIIKEKLTPEQFSACATISWSKLEKAYAETFPRGQKQQAKQALEDKLNEANLLKGGGEVTYLAKTKETN